MNAETIERDLLEGAGRTTRDKLRFAVYCATLAPSSHNSQPWIFVLQHDSVLLCADRLRALPVVDPFDRELIISCGAALLNLRVALSRAGCPYQIELFPYPADPDVLAEVRVCPDGFVDPRLSDLFTALRRRSTNRNDFGPDEVPDELQRNMREAAEAEYAHLACVASPFLREQLAELIAEGDRIQFSDPGFRRELAAWIHSSRHDDGMPAYSQGSSELLETATPIISAVIRTFDVGNGVAASHHRLAQGSPLLACLSTTTDDASAWLVAGQAMQRVLLTITDACFDASFVNQPIEVASLRPRLRELTRSQSHPQILLRVGSGKATPRAPRRPLSEVLR